MDLIVAKNSLGVSRLFWHSWYRFFPKKRMHAFLTKDFPYTNTINHNHNYKNELIHTKWLSFHTPMHNTPILMVNGTKNCGRANIGSIVIATFSFSKVVVVSTVHLKAFFFSSKLVRSVAINAHLMINLL